MLGFGIVHVRTRTDEISDAYIAPAYWSRWDKNDFYYKTKVREKSRECHNHKPQPFPDTKRMRKPTNPNKHKSNKRTKSTKIGSLFPKRGELKRFLPLETSFKITKKFFSNLFEWQNYENMQEGVPWYALPTHSTEGIFASCYWPSIYPVM